MSVQVHICLVCFQPSTAHPAVAANGERYWPPLCCPGCPCGSGEVVAPSTVEPGEKEANERRCPDCQAPIPIKVCQSAAGFYIGRECECGPYERISADYFPTREQAEAAVTSGDYDTRDYALENQGVGR